MSSLISMYIFILTNLHLLQTSFQTTITIPLSKSTTTSSPNQWQHLTNLVSASISRAHHLKYQNNNNTHLIKIKTFPTRYGVYSIPLTFGTPPQQLNFVMDTSSSLVWLPCNVCSNCTYPNTDPKNINTFIPRLSSSAKILGCRDPKCGLVCEPNVNTRCAGFDQNSSTCSQACPIYLYVYHYGSGQTSGLALLLLENLNYPERIVPGFMIGCSTYLTRQTEGIAGFGRGSTSLPVQMGLKKFSYCLVSHKYDDVSTKSSDLVLDSGHGKVPDGVKYTPFRKNPDGAYAAFPNYYYVTLRTIIVGEKRLKIPYKFMVPGSDGNGGTIVDSGSTFTFMDKRVFEIVAREFELQMGNLTIPIDMKHEKGLRPCFNVSKQETASFPKMYFVFKGGAKMELPLANYFIKVKQAGVVCLAILSSDFTEPESLVGPAIVMGNYQQQNYYVVYDLEKERFGFKKSICK